MQRDVDSLEESKQRIGKEKKIIELTISLIETETESERDTLKLPVKVPADWTKKCDKKCQKSKRIRKIIRTRTKKRKLSKMKATALPDNFPDPDRIHDQKLKNQ